MNPTHRLGILTLITPVLFVLWSAQLSPAQATPQYPDFPSETPPKFQPKTDSFDYVRREVMIPMRDGVKLHAIILVPKGAQKAPILLTRTPYKAFDLTTRLRSSHLGPSLW